MPWASGCLAIDNFAQSALHRSSLSGRFEPNAFAEVVDNKV